MTTLAPAAPLPNFAASAAAELRTFVQMFGPLIAQLRQQIATAATSARVKADANALASVVADVGNDAASVMAGNAAAAVALSKDVDRLHAAIAKLRADATSEQTVGPFTMILGTLEDQEAALRQVAATSATPFTGMAPLKMGTGTAPTKAGAAKPPSSSSSASGAVAMVAGAVALFFILKR